MDHFVETLTGAAIDSARINTTVAAALVQWDQNLTAPEKMRAMECLDQADAWLCEARSLVPSEMTSMHVVPGAGRIEPIIEVARR